MSWVIMTKLETEYQFKSQNDEINSHNCWLQSNECSEAFEFDSSALYLIWMMSQELIILD